MSLKAVLVATGFLFCCLLALGGFVFFQFFASPVDDDSAFVAAVEAGLEQGDFDQEVDIADLTSFEWNRLYVFDEWSTSDDVNAIVGAEVYGGADRRLPPHGSLLVFLLDDELTHAAWISRPITILSITKYQYGPDAWISGGDGDVLVIADPSTTEG